jgi:hypothetical protein
MNLGETAVKVEVATSDPSGGGDPQTVAASTLQTLDSVAQEVFAADYVITVTRTSGSGKPTVCKLTVADKEIFAFFITDNVVGIVKDGVPPSSHADLIVGSSKLCGK